MEFTHLLTADFKDKGAVPERNFIQSSATADHEAAVGVESGEGRCQQACAGVAGGANQLMPRAGGAIQWANLPGWVTAAPISEVT